MRRPSGRLGEEQALLGHQPRQPALAAVARQGPKVAGRVVAEKREMESVLAVGLPWHAPVLQPSRVKIGTMSSPKSHGGPSPARA